LHRGDQPLLQSTTISIIEDKLQEILMIELSQLHILLVKEQSMKRCSADSFDKLQRLHMEGI
jgi:hypothetical protein